MLLEGSLHRPEEVVHGLQRGLLNRRRRHDFDRHLHRYTLRLNESPLGDIQRLRESLRTIGLAASGGNDIHIIP